MGKHKRHYRVITAKGPPWLGCRRYMVAICAAIWLLFYYVPGHGEEPKIEDSVLYHFCAPMRDADLEWFMKELDKRQITRPGTKESGRWCVTLLGADLRSLADELRKRGYGGGHFSSSFLLPSQEKPNFFNRRMCRDHDVVSGILTAAKSILKTRVTVAGSDGPNTAHDPDDIILEAVYILDADGKAAIWCSVTVTANGISERIAYVVGPQGTPGSYENAWVVKFGGDVGGGAGGRRLFPETIQFRRPRPSEVPPQ